MTPIEVARRLLRRKADPGLIAAYLALEVRLNPTLVETPSEELEEVEK